ncbi:putative RNA-directed DNA polymerase from transposon X-element, partial [Trichonephila clavata]
MLICNGVSINTISEIANTLAETFAKTSSCDNYTPTFQALKRREERVKLNFSSSNEEGYNSPLTLLELRVALHRSGNTAAGPDGLHYIMLRHLSESSILSLLLLFNRIWETQVFPTQWCHAHVLPFPKPERQIQTTINNFTKEQSSFVFSTEETVSVVFSRNRGVFPNPKLFIGRSLIKVVKEFKFLGLIFDQSLRFHRHLKDLKIRSAKALNILKILDPVHHQGLRLCLGAFRTSPVESLYAEAYEPPLDLRRKYLCLNHFMKIQSMKTNTAYSYLFNFSLYDFNSHRSSLTYSQPFHFRIRDLINDLNLNIGRIALCKISEVPPWKVIYPKFDFTLSCYSKACTPESTYRTLYLEHRELFSDYEPIFTDGSKSESHVGSAVVSLSTVITDALPISASIYTAELHALRIAIEHISLSRGKKFIIYTALQSIVSLHSSSHPILVDITYALANHLKKKDIRFCWIPGHAGITGNELADTAARSATGSSERFPIPHSDLKACFKQKLQSVWQSNWDQQTENKLHNVMPVLAQTVPSSSNRREQVIWTRLRLRHTRLTHRHLLFGEPPPYCEIFGPQERQTVPPAERVQTRSMTRRGPQASSSELTLPVPLAIRGTKRRAMLKPVGGSSPKRPS